MYSREDHGPGTDECKVTDDYLSSKPCTWGDVNAITDDAIMID